VGRLILNGVARVPGTYDNSNEPTFMTGNEEIVVVPEPSIWAMAMARTGLLLALQKLRRRRTQVRVDQTKRCLILSRRAK
jgi:hypothetical protein